MLHLKLKRLKRLLILKSQCTLVDKTSLLSFNYLRLEIAVLLFILDDLLISLRDAIGPVQFIRIDLIPANVLKDAIVGPLPSNKAP